MTARNRLIAGCLVATAALSPVAIGALASPASAGSKDYTICHATSSAKNPYVLISPAHAGVAHGHFDHHDHHDIIPPFEYKGKLYSQNWDAEGQAIHANGCAVPTQPPVEEPPLLLPQPELPPIVVPPVDDPPAEQPTPEEPPVEEPLPDEPVIDEPLPDTIGF